MAGLILHISYHYNFSLKSTHGKVTRHSRRK